MLRDACAVSCQVAKNNPAQNFFKSNKNTELYKLLDFNDKWSGFTTCADSIVEISLLVLRRLQSLCSKSLFTFFKEREMILFSVFYFTDLTFYLTDRAYAVKPCLHFLKKYTGAHSMMSKNLDDVTP